LYTRPYRRSAPNAIQTMNTAALVRTVHRHRATRTIMHQERSITDEDVYLSIDGGATGTSADRIRLRALSVVWNMQQTACLALHFFGRPVVTGSGLYTSVPRADAKSCMGMLAMRVGPHSALQPVRLSSLSFGDRAEKSSGVSSSSKREPIGLPSVAMHMCTITTKRQNRKVRKVFYYFLICFVCRVQESNAVALFL
jgi:hypothetical protein